MKKIFIISTVLLTIVLIFLGIYNFAFRKDVPVIQKEISSSNSPSNSSQDLGENKLVTSTSKIKAVSGRGAIGAVLDKKNETVLYYSAATGTLWRADIMGANEQQVSDQAVAGLKNVLWSPDRNRVLTTLEKDGQLSFYEYDQKAQKGVRLKDGLDTVVWDSLGAKIFYKYYDAKSNERTLNVANPDGSEWQKLADISYKNLSIAAVPLSSAVSFWNSPDAGQESILQTVGITGGDTKTVFSGRYGGDYLWSPDGTRALVSSLASKDNNAMTLGIVTQDGAYKELNIPTMVSKCAWSVDNKTVYYALPGGIPDGAIMPNDYMDKKFTTQDTFWKIDTTTGEKSRVINVNEIGESYDSFGMFLSSTEDALFFINKIDQKLYRIAL